MTDQIFFNQWDYAFVILLPSSQRELDIIKWYLHMWDNKTNVHRTLSLSSQTRHFWGKQLSNSAMAFFSHVNICFCSWQVGTEPTGQIRKKSRTDMQQLDETELILELVKVRLRPKEQPDVKDGQREKCMAGNNNHVFVWQIWSTWLWRGYDVVVTWFTTLLGQAHLAGCLESINSFLILFDYIHYFYYNYIILLIFICIIEDRDRSCCLFDFFLSFHSSLKFHSSLNILKFSAYKGIHYPISAEGAKIKIRQFNFELTFIGFICKGNY